MGNATINGPVSATVTAPEEFTSWLNPPATISHTISVSDPDGAAEESFVGLPLNIFRTYGHFTFDPTTATWTYTLRYDGDGTVYAAWRALTAGEQVTETMSGVAGNTAAMIQTADGTFQDLTITIIGVNDAALFGAGDKLSIDSDNTGAPGNTITVVDFDKDESFLKDLGTITHQGTYGTFTLNTRTNQWSYNLDNDNSTVATLALNASIEDSWMVETLDGTKNPLTVTIYGVDRKTVISGTTTGAIDYRSAADLTGALTLTDTDSPAPSGLIQGETMGIYGKFTVDGTTNTWTYNLNETDPFVKNSIDQLGALQETFDILTTDGGSNTVTIAIGKAHSAPVAANGQVRGDEDAGVSLASAFTFTDAETDLLAGVTIVSVSGSGKLFVNGAEIAAGTALTASQVAGLTFRGASNAFGDALATITYQVRDSGGTRFGGTDLSAPATLSISLDDVFDTFTGDAKANLLDGTEGREKISGLGGRDTLNGFGGDDVLEGGKGADILSGGAGNDRLVGGGGNDTFLFRAGTGADTIVGFHAATFKGDRIDLAPIDEIKNFADLMKNHATQSGKDVIISAGSDQMILKAVSLDDLARDDFLF